MNKYLKGGEIKINPVDGIVADKSLIRTNFECDFIIPSYEEMMKDLADWMFGHKELYSHYNLF